MDGYTFEIQVASLYEGLGYTVDPDRTISGQQVDLIVRRTVPGMPLVRLAVECKYSDNPKGSIGNEDVSSFCNFVTRAQGLGLISGGVLVTNRTFTRHAKEVADQISTVSLLTVDQLENQLFELKDTYIEYLDYYDKLSISKSYVSLSANKGKSFIEDIDEYIMNALSSNTIDVFFILGDYGAGKTTLVNKLKYNFSKEYVGGNNSLKPIIVRLKDFHKLQDLDLLLIRSMSKEFKREIPLNIFWRLAHEGQFIFLLDGFDEMVPKGDRNSRAEQFILLSPLLTSKSKVVVTCRPSYFVSSEEYNTVISKIENRNASVVPSSKRGVKLKDAGLLEDYKSLKKRLEPISNDHDITYAKFDRSCAVIDLVPFDEMQIKQYLQKFDTEFRASSNNLYTWSNVFDFLQDVYDLRDLARRPILLKMIVETVLNGSVDISRRDITFGPSLLYEIYTDGQLDRDWRKGEVRQLVLTKEQRRSFAETIALSMLKSSELEVSYGQICEIIKSEELPPIAYENQLLNVSAEELASDIQLCSFLTRCEEGTFRFVHKSFMEFFTARYLKCKLVEMDRDDLLYTVLPREILYFLGGFAMLESTLRSILERPLTGRSLTTTRARRKRENCFVAILYSGRIQRHLAVEGVSIKGIDLSKIELSRCVFENCKISFSRYTEVQVFESRFEKVEFDECELFEFHVQGTNGTLFFKNCLIINLSLTNTTLTINNSLSRLKELTVKQSTLDMHGNVEVENCSTHSTELQFFQSVNLKNCRLENTTTHFTSGGNLQTISAINSRIFAVLKNNNSLWIYESIFTHSEIFTYAATAGCVSFSNSKYTDCNIFGLEITKKQYESLCSGKQEFFMRCKGFVCYTLHFDSGEKRQTHSMISQISDQFYLVEQPSYFSSLEEWYALLDQLLLRGCSGIATYRDHYVSEVDIDQNQTTTATNT